MSRLVQEPLARDQGNRGRAGDRKSVGATLLWTSLAKPSAVGSKDPLEDFEPHSVIRSTFWKITGKGMTNGLERRERLQPTRWEVTRA